MLAISGHVVPLLWLLAHVSDWLASRRGSENLKNKKQISSNSFYVPLACVNVCVCYCVFLSLTKTVAYN